MYMFFSSTLNRVSSPSRFPILSSLYGDRGSAFSGRSRRFRQLLKNRQSLLQAALIQWPDFGIVLYQGEKRALRAGRMHLVDNSSPEPNREAFNHSSNKRREQVLAWFDVRRIIKN